MKSPFSGKNIKLFYYINNLYRLLMPKWIYQIRLKYTLTKVNSRKDKEYIFKRVNYYNKLDLNNINNKKTLKGFKYIKLANHKYSKKANSVYFFDTYQYTRWFKDSNNWNYLPGDIISVPEVPAIVKSRPINEDNSNSVLLNLDKVRHFIFLNDKIPFNKKIDKSIFRLAITWRPHRKKFVEMYYNHPICDAGVIPPCEGSKPEWIKEKITLYDHLVYKFILAIEGNDVATNLKWVMSTNSIAVMPQPTYETWFMEGSLIPNYHYIEIKNDYTDLEQRLKYYIENPKEAEFIIKNANEYVLQFKNKKREKLISLLVLDKFFKYTSKVKN